MRGLILLAFLSVGISEVFSIRFNVELHKRKCVRDEIYKNEPVAGEYEISEVQGLTTQIIITDSKGNRLFMKQDANKGKFAFTIEEHDRYEICFDTQQAEGNAHYSSRTRSVLLDVKRGPEAQSFEAVSDAGALKPLEVSVKRLAETSRFVAKGFEVMKARALNMHAVNVSTHNRLLYFGIFAMLCLIGVTVWEVLYLRRFFKSKRLMD